MGSMCWGSISAGLLVYLLSNQSSFSDAGGKAREESEAVGLGALLSTLGMAWSSNAPMVSTKSMYASQKYCLRDMTVTSC